MGGCLLGLVRVCVGNFWSPKDCPVPGVAAAESVTFTSLPLSLHQRLFRSESSDACLDPQGLAQDTEQNGGNSNKILS